VDHTVRSFTLLENQRPFRWKIKKAKDPTKGTVAVCLSPDQVEALSSVPVASTVPKSPPVRIKPVVVLHMPSRAVGVASWGDVTGGCYKQVSVVGVGCHPDEASVLEAANGSQDSMKEVAKRLPKIKAVATTVVCIVLHRGDQIPSTSWKRSKCIDITDRIEAVDDLISGHTINGETMEMVTMDPVRIVLKQYQAWDEGYGDGPLPDLVKKLNRLVKMEALKQKGPGQRLHISFHERSQLLLHGQPRDNGELQVVAGRIPPEQQVLPGS
jgi:hypothetical protein